MSKENYRLLLIAILAFSFFVAHAQSPQQIVQQAVNAEHTADQNDHSQWIYFEHIHKPKEDLLQWVADTPQGDVQRVLERNGQELSESRQRDSIQEFLHNTKARNKQIAENHHDDQQIDSLLKLLPSAFLWTQTGSTSTNTSLHFVPAPNFHPPTREARVFYSMTGDLVVDKQQHRIRSMRGHLFHEVTFGGGLLGKLKEGSSFSLEQEEVGPSLWQLTEIHVHLEGNALLFKSISLQQDDERSRFEPEPSTIPLDQAAAAVMRQPAIVQLHAQLP